MTKYKNRGYRIYTALQTEKGEFIVVGVDVKNAGRELEINAISTVFGRRSNANLPENEEVIYVSETITPEQQSLLSRPNSDQYPAERESSTHKDTPSTPNSQANKSKSNVAKKDKPITTSDLFPKVDNSKKLGKEISRQSAVTDKNVTLTRIDYENGYVCRVENKQGDFVEQAYNADGTPMSQALYNIGIDNNQFKDFVKQDADGLYIKDKHLFEVLVQNAEQQKDILPNEEAPLTEDKFEEALNTNDIDKVTDALKLTRNAIELNSIDDIQEGDIVLITHMNAELLKKGETGTYVYKARKKLSRSYDLESVLADGSISITNEDIESIKRTPGGSLTIYRVKPELADRLKRGEEEKQRKLREENLKFEEEMRKKAEASAKRREKARAQEKANEERAERIFDMAQEAENVEDFFKMASEIYQVTGFQADLRDIFNMVKNHELNSSREMSFYTRMLTPNEEQEAERSEDSPTSRKHKAEAEAQTATTEDTARRDALTDLMQQSGMEVFVDEKAQQVLDEVNGNGAQIRLQAMIKGLNKASNFILSVLKGQTKQRKAKIEIPEIANRLAEKTLKHPINSHSINANEIVHIKKRHGENGTANNSNSIPLRDEDISLMPYIMAAPTKVVKGSTAVNGTESVRYEKELENGYVVVVEREGRFDVEDMENITMWAQKKPATNVTVATRTSHSTSETIVISETDVAKIKKDAEDAIRKEEKLREHLVPVKHGDLSDAEITILIEHIKKRSDSIATESTEDIYDLLRKMSELNYNAFKGYGSARMGRNREIYLVKQNVVPKIANELLSRGEYVGYDEISGVVYFNDNFGHQISYHGFSREEPFSSDLRDKVDYNAKWDGIRESWRSDADIQTIKEREKIRKQIQNEINDLKQRLSDLYAQKKSDKYNQPPSFYIWENNLRNAFEHVLDGFAINDQDEVYFNWFIEKSEEAQKLIHERSLINKRIAKLYKENPNKELEELSKKLNRLRKPESIERTRKEIKELEKQKNDFYTSLQALERYRNENKQEIISVYQKQRAIELQKIKVLSREIDAKIEELEKQIDEVKNVELPKLSTLRFFRTPGGEAYGFTVNGKIYLDPRIATAETAIHEYAHLWADMLRQMNPEAWNDIVQLMKGTSVWDEVKSLYPELKTDDEIADEVLAHYSGRQGAAKLREEHHRIAHDQNMDLRSKATAIAALERIKQALTKFWKGVADLLHIRFTTAEEVADRVLADLLHGVNPNKYIKRKGKGVQKLHLNDKTLAGIHNITEEKLRKALNLGGLANPSLAIIDTAQNKHEGFGEISLIAPSELVDKETGHTAGTWTTDAYTQRYPYVERVMSESGYKKFDKWVESLDLTDSEKAEVRRQAKDSLENNSTPAWEMMYLREKGIDIKAYTSEVTYRWHQLFDTYDSVDELLEGMKQDEELQKKVINYVKAELSEPIRKKIRAQFREQIKEETGEDPVILPPRYMRKVTEIFNRDYAKDLFGEDLMPGEEDVKKVMQQLFDLHNRTKQVDFSLSKSKASTYVHSHDLYSDYLRWQNKKLKEFGVKGRLFRGYSADGSRKYIPETLKNVSKAMVADAKGQTNGGEMVSLGSFVAKFADRVDSTDEMRANKKRLANNESKQGFYSEWMPTYNELAHELSDDIFAGEQRLHDITVQDNPVKYAKKEYGITLSKSFMDKLNAFKKAIREDMTSAYFETKFERPVYLNEFAAAVIPSDLSEDVKGGLEKSGIAIYEYDPKIEGDRDRATNAAFEADNRIRFQLIGEKGAANMDKAEEANTRLDNLAVAREMEQANKDAKAIKLATGWERGADGKWRYEIMDGELKKEPNVKEKVSSDGEVHYETTLGEILDNEQLYRSYPELRTLPVSIQQMDGGVSGIYLPSGYLSLSMGLYRHRTKLGDVRREIEQIESTPEYKEYSKYFEDDMPDAYIGREDEWEKAMDEAEAKFFESELGKRYHDLMWGYKRKAYSYGFDEIGKGVILHEVQHAIQHIEGFAQGGNSTTYREHLAQLKPKHDVWSWVQEFKDKKEELGSEASQDDVYYDLINEFKEDGYEFGEDFMPTREVFDQAFDLWVRGTGTNGYEAAFNEYQRLTEKFGLGGENNHYKQLSGEVEARNVQKRLHMTPEERRQSLAEETEDVAREDQVFILENAERADSLGDSTSFTERQERAVKERGVVSPGLNDAVLNIKEVPMHPYEGRWTEARSAAIEDAYLKFSEEIDVDGKKVREPRPLKYDNFGNRFTYTISKGSLRESVNPKQIEKSKQGGAPAGVHLAVLNHLDKVIANSIEVEEHPDYQKGEDGVRSPENGYNSDMLVHRFVGVVRIDGQEYLVKTTMHEHRQAEQGNRQYAYDVTKIAVLNAETPITANGLATAAKGLLPLAKVLKDFDKSYDSGKNLLEESKKADKNRFSNTLQRENAEAQAAHPTSEAEVSEAANDAAQSLHLDNVTILGEEDLASLTPKQRSAKGWFDPKTGRIYINASNHANEADVVQTVLHEAVAHFGLRALFGKDFDTMLDQVYRAAGSALYDANINHLYVCEVFLASKIENGNTLQTAASQPHGGIALYKDILANVLDTANVAQSFDTSNTLQRKHARLMYPSSAKQLSRL